MLSHSHQAEEDGSVHSQEGEEESQECWLKESSEGSVGHVEIIADK